MTPATARWFPLCLWLHSRLGYQSPMTYEANRETGEPET